MANISRLTLSKGIDGKWTFGVIRDDDYREVTTTDTDTIKTAIDQLVKFADTVKTKEQIALEETQKRADEALKVIYKKTTIDERLTMTHVLKRWQVDEVVKKGDERTYNNVLYIVKKDHTCTYENIPINDKSLWRKALATAELPDIYNHEKKYKINDKCVFNGRIWSSLITQEGQSPFASPKTWEDEGEV